MGSIKFGIFKGGGCMFGLRFRNYLFKLNKNLKWLVCCFVLIMKVNDNVIVVLEDFIIDIFKIKEFILVLKFLGFENKKFLFVLGDLNNNVYLLFCNLKGIEVVINLELSIYKIMNVNSFVLFEGFLEEIE